MELSEASVTEDGSETPCCDWWIYQAQTSG
jgi:hypothetical protein